MKKIFYTLYLIVIISLFIFISCSKSTEPNFTIDGDSCTGCGECVEVCPYNAIEILENGKAVIDQSSCEQCGDCVEACPEGAIN